MKTFLRPLGRYNKALRWIRPCAAVLLVASLALILARAWFGPLPHLITARSTVNVAALAFISLCAWLGRRETTAQATELLSVKTQRWILAGVAAATFLGFLQSLWFPFLFDDYVHLMFVSTESWSALVQRVIVHHPTGGDLFFRPLGDLTFRFIYQWAAFDVRGWHAAGLLLHTANTLLVLVLARRISENWLAGVTAGLFFGWCAAHVEAVSWISAMYDLLATFFVLLALLQATGRRKGHWRRVLVACFAVFACASKESAYCLPLLAAALAALEPKEFRSQAWRKILWIAAGCAVVFAYRFWYLGGLGGYRVESGGSLAAHLRPLSALQAIGLRLWGMLLLPVNWTIPPEFYLQAGITCLVVAILLFAWRAKLEMRPFLCIVAFTVCAALPVISLLLIGFDLSGARVLYLPSVGVALLWALIAGKVDSRKKWAIATCSLFLVFQLGALQHNQQIWGSVSRTAVRACSEVGDILRKERGTVFAVNPPRTKDGVFFLQNAFPACVAFNGGVDPAHVKIGGIAPSPVPPREQVLIWDDAVERWRVR